METATVTMEITLFVAGLILGGLTSWIISYRYYQKSTRDLRSELDNLSRKLRPKTTLQDFEQLLESSAWGVESVDGREVWISEIDNTFQIVQGERGDEFTEEWTARHPDPHSWSYPIYLKINGIVIKELRFISVDGGRIFVPMPEVRAVDGKRNFFWRTSSIEFKVGRVVGSYYRYDDLYGVAKRSKIEIVRE
jgi:hypothetical protein